MLFPVGPGTCKGITVAAMLATAVAGGSPKAIADGRQLTVDYSFKQPVLSKIQIGEQWYDRITMRDCPQGGYPGEPALPATGTHILLPYGTDVVGIEVIIGAGVSLGSDYLIEPVGEPVRLSAPPGTARIPEPDPKVYELNHAFPIAKFENVGIQGFRGYQILVLKLQPVQYVPVSGELTWFPEMTVNVHVQGVDQKSPLLRQQIDDHNRVMQMVDNPVVADTYPTVSERRGGFDMLILTTPAFASSFGPLKAYHDANGVITEIHTTTDVGSNDPVAVRNYIRDQYINNGIEYVLIGGDDDIIPCKDLYVDGESNMPGDIFFSCLDGTWNWDNDGYFGEPNDGEGGGDVDLIAEVYVGRACAGNTTEADRFVDKTLWYLTGQHTTATEALLVGEYLGFGGVAEWGGNYLDELPDGSSAHGYTTVGIPTDQYNIDTLYERDVSWGKWDLIGKLDDGLHILNHLGHGAPDYAMHLYSSDILADVHNDDLCFIYSQTCSAGHLDGTDCWAEHMNIKIDEGAYAVIMNARYGYGEWNSTDGPSQRFNREFWDAVFNQDEGLPELGKANSDSKEDNIYRINESCMRWCTYELNLFGDPSVSFIGAVPPLSIFFPNGHPEYIDPGVPTIITVEIMDRAENYVPGSGQLHYRFDGGTYQTSPLVHVGGDLYEATLPAAACDDTPEYYFSAAGDGRTMVYSPYDAPNSIYSVIVGELIMVLDEDFEDDNGWTVQNYNLDTGAWERAVPAGSGGGRGDPSADYDGSGKCFVTGNGYDEDIDSGPTVLTSPTYDLTDVQEPYLSYARWFYNDDNDVDNLLCEISNDNGSSWVTLEDVGNESGWQYVTFLVEDFVTPNNQIKLRFSATDNPNDSVTEAGIDSVRFTSFVCDDLCPADLTGDSQVNIDDIFAVLGLWGDCPDPCPPYCEGDLTEDCTVNIDDIFAILGMWGPCN